MVFLNSDGFLQIRNTFLDWSKNYLKNCLILRVKSIPLLPITALAVSFNFGKLEGGKTRWNLPCKRSNKILENHLPKIVCSTPTLYRVLNMY